MEDAREVLKKRLVITKLMEYEVDEIVIAMEVYAGQFPKRERVEDKIELFRKACEAETGLGDFESDDLWWIVMNCIGVATLAKWELKRREKIEYRHRETLTED